MKVMFRDQNLPVERLFPHPDNPRQDIGDVTELAASIKENGLFQNLTVVRGGKGVPADDSDAGFAYTVIIGHRRLAAAKLAGLSVVPCMIVSMDEREQAATMLLENMQRSDLTIFEQAQGFQMMLDLGVTQDDIAKKTGLSKTTVRHRLKLLELDPEELKKAQERQATITDYIELEKISDPELKNEALKEIGTENFGWAVKSAIRKINEKKNIQDWLAYLPTVADKIEPRERTNRQFLKWICIASTELTEEEKEKVEALFEEHDLHYSIENQGKYVCLSGKFNIAIESDDEFDRKMKKEEEEKIRREIHDVEEMMADSRSEFLDDFFDRRFISDITAIFLRERDLEDIDYEKVAEYLNIEYDQEENEWDPVKPVITSEDYEDYAEYNPHLLMVAMLRSIYEQERKLSLTDFSGITYKQNPRLEHWYEILKKIGYKMSSAEKSMLDGTHKCFGTDEED